MRTRKLLTYALVSILLVYFLRDTGMAAEDWSMTLYGAKLTGDSLLDTFMMSSDYDHSYLVALALSKRFASFRHYIDWEIEGQAVKHFGYQHHKEFNGLIVARWRPFPWDRYLDTTFAVGEGLSYATETPRFEALQYDETSRLLNYLMFELAFSLPEVPQWSVVGRIHHRSGAWGLFNGVHGASNALGLGLRCAF